MTLIRILSAITVATTTFYTRFRSPRKIVYAFSFFVLASLYTLLLIVLEYIFDDMTGVTAPVSAGATILVGTYTLPRMEIYFQKLTDPWFFKEPYDYFAVLDELAIALDTNLNLRPLVMQTLSVIDRTFKPTYSYFVRVGSSEERFSHSSHVPTVRDKTKSTSRHVHLPIYSGKTLIGQYMIGPKRSGDPYVRVDRALLQAFKNSATVAFQKAALYQQLREYSEQLEAKVDERTKHLRNLQERQREFFDDISHALQTPLAILKSSLERLRHSNQEYATKIYAAIETSIDDLSHLTRAILRLARIDTDQQEDSPQVFDVSAMISRLIESVAVIAESVQVALTVGCTPGVYVRGNERQLEEALTNVLSNSIKYTAGCAVRTIEVSLRTHSANAAISVADSGIGMTPKDTAQAFERFYRSSRSGHARNGNGLGLAITKRIIERHKGTISLESTLGTGTTVYISLPGVSPEDPQT